jgi:hypothetical protein
MREAVNGDYRGAFLLQYRNLENVMRVLGMLLVPALVAVLSGCVVTPRGYGVRPRVAVVAPVPVVVVRPAYYYRYRW